MLKYNNLRILRKQKNSLGSKVKISHPNAFTWLKVSNFQIIKQVSDFLTKPNLFSHPD